MARWRLTAPHYLNVPGTEVEFKETDRDTGKQARKVYQIPRLLSPDDPGDCFQGECIVAYAKGAERRDIVFVGPPTPDMEPLDAEAEEISNRLRPSWKHPIESLPGTGGDYGQALIQAFEKQIAALMRSKAVDVPNTSVSPEEFKALQAQVAALMARNAELETKAPAARRA